MRPSYSLAPMRDRITTFFAAMHESTFGTKRDIATLLHQCPLSGAKRTFLQLTSMSVIDAKRNVCNSDAQACPCSSRTTRAFAVCLRWIAGKVGDPFFKKINMRARALNAQLVPTAG
jgi:hypothetical protein